jgi:hypothetical protein
VEIIGTGPVGGGITKTSTPEEAEAFRQRLAERQAQMEALEEAYIEESACALDTVIGEFLCKTYVEAQWITQVGAFPNGRPLNEQTSFRLYFWQEFIRANNDRQVAMMSGGSNAIT